MRRLMSHLAQFSSIFKQGELLCTQGLAYLFQNPDARRTFAEHISEQVGRSAGSNLTWRAEVRQQDSGRCDLEASIEGNPAIKIEAKLGAAFGEGQLRSYADDLRGRCKGEGLLLVLVPLHRADEITAMVSNTFGFTGEGPWRLDEMSDCLVAVIYWEELLDALGTIRSEPFSGDLAQFQAMYRVLKGYDIEPPTSNSELLAWRQKEGVFVGLVDRVTRRLTQQSQILPMGKERGVEDYRRRYVCLPLGTEQPCFSLGTRDPFNGHETPIWMRFNRTTPKFAVIHDRLVASSLSPRLVESDGHVWIPLCIPLNSVDGESLVNSLVAQAEDVIRVAYQPS